LRAALALSASLHAAAYLFGNENPTHALRAAGCLAVAGGGLLVLGFLTPFAAVVLGLGGVAVLLSWLPGGADELTAVGLSILFVTATASAALLGPGAYSLDARLFGRREVIIPPHLHAPDS